MFQKIKNLKIFLKKNGDAQGKKEQHFCKFHRARVGHKASDCFLNRKSNHFKGDEYLKKHEEKTGQKVDQDWLNFITAMY